MSIFKAYDIRGIYPKELDEKMAGRIGAAFARFLGAKKFAVGRDVRLSSESLAKALMGGITSEGGSVADIGISTTPMLNFAVGKYGFDGGIETTASHNPGEYNGFKLCREKAIPLSEDHGIGDIAKIVSGGADKNAGKPSKSGGIEKKDIVADYKKHLTGLLAAPKPLKIVVDTANGTVGTIFPKVFDELPGTVIPLFFEPDGRFPNHEPNPLKDENVKDLVAAVKKHKADLGVAFDGDGDRCMFIDEKGGRVSSDLATALFARHFLRKNKGSAVIYDLRSSRIVAEEIRKAGGVPVKERVGHAFMKATLRKHDGVFGGELSGHFYFRDHFFTDCGMMAFVTMLNVLSEEKAMLSELVRPLKKYSATGEINFTVQDKDAKIEQLSSKFADGKQDRLDGITVEYDNWWFNVRKSNTEPLLRLNLEADTAGLMEEARKKVVDVIAGA
jgi:phosphomannomutase